MRTELRQAAMLVIGFALLIASRVGGQSVGASNGPGGSDSATRSASRTASGRPNLEGVWNFASLTPLERPTRFADQAFMTDEEAAAFEQELLEAVNLDRREPGAVLDLRGAAINEFWLERGTLASISGRKVTSLIVDPLDGRLPTRVSGLPPRPSIRKFDTVTDFE